MTHAPNHRADHQYWEYLIPFYVNRTLNGTDRAAFEHHLAHCPACRQALEDWHSVAGVVQQEVAIWAQQTPPLSSEVRAQIGLSENHFPASYAAPGASAHAPNVQDSFRSLRGGRSADHAPRRRIQVPLTLVAAAAMIVVFGALLLYMATRGDEPSSASQGEVNNIQPTLGLHATDTPLPVTYTPWAQESPAFLQSDDLGILGYGEGDQAPGVTATPSEIQALQSPGIGAGGESSPNLSVCQASPADNVAVAIYATPFSSSIVGYMTPGEWLDVFQRTVEGWYQVIWPNGYIAGWVRGDAIKLNGPCADIAYPTPTRTPAPVTPTAVFQGSIGMGYLLVTTEQVGSIPANTRVRISHAWQDSGGWWYYIVAEDETRMADARTGQLTYAPNVTPGPTPTSKAYTLAESGYSLFLLEMVGGIPANTKVSVSSGHFNGYEWVYTVIAENGAVAEAKESQLMAVPGTPTPLPPPGSGDATPTATWRFAIGTGTYDMLTTTQVGAIPANTSVRIESAYYNGSDWVYNIIAEYGYRAQAYTYQITRNMNPPNASPTPIISGPTPTNVFQHLVGNGDYRFVTREQIGAIPAYTAVRIDRAWYDGAEWNYTIVSQAGVSATGRLSQIQYPPPEVFATMTATVQFKTPTHTPTPTAQQPSAQIQSFTANPSPAAAGAMITLTWKTSNAISVSVREVKPNGQFGQWYENLATSGTLDVVAPESGVDQMTYILVAANSAGREVTGQITVRVTATEP